MPIYEIEQYELYAMKYQVEAENEAEAIVKLLGGAADAMDDGLDYIEVADEFGMDVDRHHQLADQLKALGIPVNEQVIPSICSIEQVE